MRLSFGDKIVHRVHGPGVVQGACERQVNGTPGQFYVIKMMIAKADVYVPVLETAVLRPIMHRIDLPKLERILGSKPGRLPDKRSMRHALIEQMMTKPDAGRLAEIIRDLAGFMKNHSTSSSRDYDLLRRAENLLCAEWALADDISCDAAYERLHRALRSGVQHLI